jgi:hypothetical protein
MTAIGLSQSFYQSTHSGDRIDSVISGNISGQFTNIFGTAKSKFIQSKTLYDDFIASDAAFGITPFSFLFSYQGWVSPFNVTNLVSNELIVGNAGTPIFGALLSARVPNYYVGTYGDLIGSQISVVTGNDSDAYNTNNSYFTTLVASMTYNTPKQVNPYWQITGINSYVDWASTADTVLTNNGIYGIISGANVGTNTRFNSNYYLFYSNPSTALASKMLTGKYAYHFYGLGNYPSWFGGNLNALGYNYFTDAQANDAYVVTLTGAHTLVAGLEVTFKANTANTDGATLKVNSLTVKNLMKWTATGATALATGDIIAGQIVKAVYDGTQFQIISRLAQ